MSTSRSMRLVGGLACVLAISASATAVSAPKTRDAYKNVAKTIVLRWEPPLTEGAMCIGTKYEFSFFGADRYNKPVRSSATIRIANPSGYGGQRLNRGVSVYHRFVHRVDRLPAWDRFSIYLRANGVGGGRVKKSVQMRIRHCLSGRWKRGKRTLEIEHKGNSVKAWMVGGLCRRAGRVLYFSGSLKGDRLSVKNMLTCEPRKCVKGGQKPRIIRVPWKAARVAPDSRSISGKWMAIRYKVYRQGVCRQTKQTKWLPLTIARSL